MLKFGSAVVEQAPGIAFAVLFPGVQGNAFEPTRIAPERDGSRHSNGQLAGGFVRDHECVVIFHPPTSFLSRPNPAQLRVLVWAIGDFGEKVAPRFPAGVGTRLGLLLPSQPLPRLSFGNPIEIEIFDVPHLECLPILMHANRERPSRGQLWQLGHKDFVIDPNPRGGAQNAPFEGRRLLKLQLGEVVSRQALSETWRVC